MNSQQIGTALLAATLMAGCAGTRSDFREVIRETGDEVFPSLVYIRVVRDDSDHLKEHFSPRRKGCGFAVGGRALKLFKVRYRKIPEAGASARKMADKWSCRSEA